MKTQTKKQTPKQNEDPQNNVIVALDTADLSVAKALISELKDVVRIFKVGTELFTAHGPKAVEIVKGAGRDVFLDLKFHDIPNTVAQSVRAAVRQEIFMLNLHIPGGIRMMQEACIASIDEARRQNTESPKLIGVTLLTSLTEDDVKKQIGISKSIKETALRYATLAQNAGLDGVVASALEAKKIRAACGSRFIVVTPGIRPKWANKDDQARVMTPKEAFRLGSSYIVVGRPITEAKDPREAANRVFAEL